MLPIVEKFPKAIFARADVERERMLRLSIHGVVSSDITEEPDTFILTTVFMTTAGPPPAPTGRGEARAAGAGPSTHAAGPPAHPVFAALVPGGFFSADPNDHHVPRAIRTNNPGALNISAWQRARKGFVGVTESDGSASQNQTTIYRTPEHGVASWFHLLNVVYGLGSRPSFTINELAQMYSGVSSGPPVDEYIRGWTAASAGTINATTDIAMNDPAQFLQLARAMFVHEAGKPSPLLDAQIAFAVRSERDGSLPN